MYRLHPGVTATSCPFDKYKTYKWNFLISLVISASKRVRTKSRTLQQMFQHIFFRTKVRLRTNKTKFKKQQIFLKKGKKSCEINTLKVNELIQ